MFKKIISSIFSMEIMGMGLLIFAFSMGFATFIENKYGTIAARGLVYNAWWFELIMLYAMVSLAYNVIRFKMYEPGRWGGLVFHLAFIFMILGAGITRYVGDEGNMSIRENNTSNFYITADKYFIIEANKGSDEYKNNQRSLVSVLKPKKIKDRFSVDGTRVHVVSKGVYEPQQHGEVLVVDVQVDGTHKDVAIPLGTGLERALKDVEIGGVKFKLGYAHKKVEVPFELFLDDFILERYAGSMNPSSYRSLVTLIDKEKGIRMPFEIKMNHVLDHRGYRFFQSSYDTDEKGTVLSVNKDKPGTMLSYIGYFLLFGGILWAMFDSKSRFRMYLRMTDKKRVSAVVVLLLMATATFAKNNDTTHDDLYTFNHMWVQSGDGRIKPMVTFADEAVRKIHKSRTYEQYNASEVLHGFFTNPSFWMKQDIIATTDHPAVKKLGIEKEFASFLDFYDTHTGQYLLMNDIRGVLAIPASERSKPDKYLLDMDERIQICRMLISGNLPLLFPNVNDEYKQWVSLADFSKNLSGDSLALARGFLSPDKAAFAKSMEFITAYQKEIAPESLPSQFRQKMEFFYMRVNIFEKLTLFYGITGTFLMLFSLLRIFTGASIFKNLQTVMRFALYGLFMVHTLGMVARGVISGHVPVSNGYESIVLVAWSAMLAGILFSRRNAVVFSLGAIIAAFAMLVSHMSFMNPQITQLVPVLKSYWLTIHVTMVTSSYGFFGAAFIIGLFNMIMMAIAGKNENSKWKDLIEELYPVNQLAMEVGLYLITIGCFLGAIWANVSWGRYWSWDPKETWCLISILIYAFVMHMHHIPGFNGKHYFSAASVIAFSSILMTYFGVNFFLGGMHAYAGEGSVALSAPWYIVTVLLFALIFYSGHRYNRR